jgi:DNA-binding transcriptional MerR regulator
MIGVPASTIRTWEERYGLVEPGRSEGGHRLYTRDHVEQLRFVKSQIDQGVTPASAHRLLAEHLTTGTPRGGGEERPRLLILLAERDRYAAELEEYFFRTEGYEVVVSHDVEDVEQKARDLSPELIVVELMISGGVGAELCRRLKEQVTTPILAISSLAARDEALVAGADGFVQKPVDPLQLVSAARDLLVTSAMLGRDV